MGGSRYEETSCIRVNISQMEGFQLLLSHHVITILRRQLYVLLVRSDRARAMFVFIFHFYLPISLFRTSQLSL